MIEITKCEGCGAVVLTGYMAYVDKQLCAACAAPYVHADAALLQAFMVIKMVREEKGK